jgi:hypothetical protein
MSYTLGIIKAGLESFVPFADKIPGMQQGKHVQFNKKNEQNRIKIAKSMKHAIKTGKINSSYSEAANKLQKNAKKNLVEASYAKSQYACDQMSKLSTFCNVIIPDSGAVISNMARTQSALNLHQYAKKSSNYLETATKVGKFTASILFDITSPIWVPLVAPPVVAVGVSALFATTLALDGLNYFRA